MNLQDTNIEKKCRICASEIFDGASGISIFSDVYLEEKIRKYLYITISQADELPKTICGSCFIKLEGIHRFACLALKTEENFLTYLSRKKFNEEQTRDVQSTTFMQPIKQEPPAATKLCNPKLSMRPYKAPKRRNARHVDHITLEQIINDKIAKNFHSQSCELIPIKPKGMSLIGYDDLKIGQFIKDQELLKLIIKALKWHSFDHMEKLKNTSFRDLLSNPNLLRDGDLVQLIKSYVGHETFSNIHNSLKSRDIDITKCAGPSEVMDLSVMLLNDDDENITRMEVRVDPDLFLPDDEDYNEGRHKNLDKNEHTTVQNVAHTPNNPPMKTFHFCTICPEKFLSNSQLEDHIVSHLVQNSKAKRLQNKLQKKSRKINVKLAS